MVDFGDKTIDLSVSSRVNKLNALLKGRLSLYCFQPLHVLTYIASRVRLDVRLLYRRVPLIGPMKLSFLSQNPLAEKNRVSSQC